MMMSMMPSIYFGAAPEPPEEDPEEFQASIDRHKLRRIIQLSNLISSFAGFNIFFKLPLKSSRSLLATVTD